MAVYNEILAGRFNRALQKLFGIKGPPPVPQLGSEILPVHPFASGVEHRFLEQWAEYGIGIQVAAVAAQFAFAQLRNPPNSGVICVVHKLNVSESTVDGIVLSFTRLTTADAGVTNALALDTRTIGNSSAVFSSGTQGASPNFGFTASSGQLWFFNLGANAPQDYVIDAVQEIPILPGMTLRINSNTVNQSLLSSWAWRERALEESEKF